MSKLSLRKLSDYFLLLFVTGTAIVLILIAGGNKQLIRYIVIGLGILYVIWGFAHHKKEGTFNREIIIEYIAITVLGTALVLGLV